MYREILVPVDGSEASRAALRDAVDMAAGAAATVRVLTVVEESGNPLAFGVDEVEEINRAVDDVAEAIATADGAADVTLRTEVRRGDPVYEVILEYAAEVDADCIVLGRHGGSALHEAIFGSTADRVSRLSDVPVVLVPAPDEG